MLGGHDQIVQLLTFEVMGCKFKSHLKFRNFLSQFYLQSTLEQIKAQQQKCLSNKSKPRFHVLMHVKDAFVWFEKE